MQVYLGKDRYAMFNKLNVALKDRLCPAIKALHTLCDDLPIRLSDFQESPEGCRKEKHFGVGRNEKIENWKQRRISIFLFHLRSIIYIRYAV